MTWVPNHRGLRPAARLATAACLLAAALSARASDAPLILEHLTTSDGLPQGTVFATLQDSQGFVWLATEDGLVRYDGHELFRYAYSRTARGGLPGNYIEAIVEDRHHDLWIAIKDGGLARWQRATDNFIVYRHDPKDTGSLASNAVHTLLVDADDRVWVGTFDAGVDVLEPGASWLRAPALARREPHLARAAGFLRDALGWHIRCGAPPPGSRRRAAANVASRNGEPCLPRQRRRPRHPRGSGGASVGRDRGRSRHAEPRHRPVQPLPS
ncbi:MAG: hypothetical protein E6K46_07060 [Gammaproteobacteria bacterium]|nr:MAG: hypothetical protein E6K46_07060 [Gammaproteobacteria bacterium]